MSRAGLMRARRVLLAGVLAASLTPSMAPARPAPASAPASAASAAPRLMEEGRYRNVDGAVVHSPAHTDTGAAPVGASARCRDGSFSFSAHRRGTCSHHGGVALWL